VSKVQVQCQLGEEQKGVSPWHFYSLLPFHRPGYPYQSEPGDVHMPFEHCLPIHGF
jgi:hypothetical protein